MEDKRTLREIINEIVKNNDEIYSVVAKVTEVDEDARTVDVEPLNGDAEIFGVRLQPDMEGTTGIVMIPKVDTNVVVTFLNKSTGYVSLVTDPSQILIDCDEGEESIVFNGGSNGSFIVIQSLVDRLNAIEDAHNGLVTTFNSHFHTTTATISASPVVGVITPPTASSTDTIAPTTSVSDIENNVIKH